MSHVRLIVLAACLTLPMLAQAGDVYRWTDAQGSVTYGSRPPADARSIKKVDVDIANVMPSDSAADQRLADDYQQSRETRARQQALADRQAARQAAANANAAAAAAYAARAQAEADCTGNWSVSCGDNGSYYPIVGARREPLLNNASPNSPGFNTPQTVPNTTPNNVPRSVPNTNAPGVPRSQSGSMAATHPGQLGY